MLSVLSPKNLVLMGLMFICVSWIWTYVLEGFFDWLNHRRDRLTVWKWWGNPWTWRPDPDRPSSFKVWMWSFVGAVACVIGVIWLAVEGAVKTFS